MKKNLFLILAALLLSASPARAFVFSGGYTPTPIDVHDEGVLLGAATSFDVRGGSVTASLENQMLILNITAMGGGSGSSGTDAAISLWFSSGSGLVKGWELYRSTGEAATKSYNLSKSTSEGSIESYRLFISSAYNILSLLQSTSTNLSSYKLAVAASTANHLSGLEAWDESSLLGNATSVFLTGAGVTGTLVNGKLIYTIPGGGGGVAGLPLPEGSTTYLQVSTSAQVRGWKENIGARISNAVFIDSFTAISTTTGRGLVDSFSLDINFSTRGAGYMLIISTDPNFPGRISAARPDCLNGTCDQDIVFTGTVTVQIGEPYALKWPTKVPIATATYAVDFPTMAGRGAYHYEGVHASTSVGAEFDLILGSLVPGATPYLNLFNAVSKAAGDSGTKVFGIYIATVGAGGADDDNLVFRSTTIVVLSGSGGASKSVKSLSAAVPLLGVNQYTRSGNMAIKIKIAPLGGGTSTADGYIHSVVTLWKEQK